MSPRSKACSLGNIFENHSSFVDKSASGDGSLLRIVHGSEGSGRGYTAHPSFSGGRGFLRLRSPALRDDNHAKAQGCGSPDRVLTAGESLASMPIQSGQQ